MQKPEAAHQDLHEDSHLQCHKVTSLVKLSLRSNIASMSMSSSLSVAACTSMLRANWHAALDMCKVQGGKSSKRSHYILERISGEIDTEAKALLGI